MKFIYITSDPNAKNDSAYDKVIWFDPLQNQASHSCQLRQVGSLIA